MARYKVTFEAKYDGEWITDAFSNGGRGLDIVEASAIKNELEEYGLDGIQTRNIRIEEI